MSVVSSSSARKKSSPRILDGADVHRNIYFLVGSKKWPFHRVSIQAV